MKHQSFAGIHTLISIFALLLTSVACTQAQPQPYNVAILLYEGVELLDFAGPGEVFGASSGFKVYTVTADGNPILSQRFVTVNPQYSIATAPPADILVFPGGGSAGPSKNPVVINWVKTRVENGATVMSVCTGAEILAKAGLLENLNVTTFHGFIPGLQSMLPNSKVLRDMRYVDNGNIITTAGVSAGIDGALHLLGRIKGLDVAKATAFYMEYDNWKSEQGKIDYQNPYIKELQAAVNQPEKSITYLKDIPKGKLPFEGEFKNLAASVKENGNLKGAARILELAKAAYPHSLSCRMNWPNYTKNWENQHHWMRAG